MEDQDRRPDLDNPAFAAALARIGGIPTDERSPNAFAAAVAEMIGELQLLDEVDLTGLHPAFKFDPRAE